MSYSVIDLPLPLVAAFSSRRHNPSAPSRRQGKLCHQSQARTRRSSTVFSTNTLLDDRPSDQSKKVRPSSSKPSAIPVSPPFPDGPTCGGTVVTIPPSETYRLDTKTLGNDWILPSREIQVRLPASYDENIGQRYPVLYCHDGQNAISDQDSWTGRSWRLAGALQRLHEHMLIDVEPILVLLPSSDEDLQLPLLPAIRRRHLEYGDYGTPFADAHSYFVAETLKPVVDTLFRTYTGPFDTAAIGTSMGGQASMNLLLKYPDKFSGGVAALSPFFGRQTLSKASEVAFRNKDILRNKKIYMDIGGDVDDIKVPMIDILDHMTPKHFWNPGYFWLDTQLQQTVGEMDAILDRAEANKEFHQVPGGRHNERAWSQRIHLPLLHLYGKSSKR